jgi:hypothetical protein
MKIGMPPIILAIVMVGYHDLQPWLQKKFPEIQSNWFTTVAFPAFVTNYTVIWKKPISVGKASS